MRRIKQDWSERCQIMKDFVVHFRDLGFAVCAIPLECFFFSNRWVLGYFNRIPLAFVLRANHRRAMVETARLEAKASIWMSEIGNLDPGGSSDVLKSGENLDVLDF